MTSRTSTQLRSSIRTIRHANTSLSTPSYINNTIPSLLLKNSYLSITQFSTSLINTPSATFSTISFNISYNSLTSNSSSTSSTLSSTTASASPFTSHICHLSRSFATASTAKSNDPASSGLVVSQRREQSTGKIPTLSVNLRRFYKLVHPDLFHSHPELRKINEDNLQQFLSIIGAMKAIDSEAYPMMFNHRFSFFIRKRPNDGINPNLHFEDALFNTRMANLERKGKILPWNAKKCRKDHEYMMRKKKIHNLLDPVPQPLPHELTEHSESDQFHHIVFYISFNGGNCRKLVQRNLQHLFARCNLPMNFTWDADFWRIRPPRRVQDEEDEFEDEV
jgi:hypothetical protein